MVNLFYQSEGSQYLPTVTISVVSVLDGVFSSSTVDSVVDRFSSVVVLSVDSVLLSDDTQSKTTKLWALSL